MSQVNENKNEYSTSKYSDCSEKVDSLLEKKTIPPFISDINIDLKNNNQVIVDNNFYNSQSTNNINNGSASHKRDEDSEKYDA